MELTLAEVQALVAAAVTEQPPLDVPQSVGGGVRFRIPLLVPTGLETGDRREFKAGGLTSRDFPLPILWQRETDDGHKRSVIVARIDKAERVKNGIGNAEGEFDTGADAQEALRLIRGLFLRGVSADVDKISAEMTEADDGKPMVVFDQARLTAGTLVPKPAFAECMIELPGDEEWERNVARLQEEGGAPQPLVAAGGPENPPAEWFQNPGLTEPTHLTVQDDGRVFGHIAAWDTDHIGMPFQRPPKSRSGYRYFTTGQVKTADGSMVDVGTLTLTGGHADLECSAEMAIKHYDDTRSAVADVAAGEDEFGIWVAGAQRPGLSERQVRAFRASDPSGDWRPMNGALELVGVLQVNVPGFPIPRPRAQVASGQVLALVAAGAAPVSTRGVAARHGVDIDSRLSRLEAADAHRRRAVADELRATVAAGQQMLIEQVRQSLVASAAEIAPLDTGVDPDPKGEAGGLTPGQGGASLDPMTAAAGRVYHFKHGWIRLDGVKVSKPNALGVSKVTDHGHEVGTVSKAPPSSHRASTTHDGKVVQSVGLSGKWRATKPGSQYAPGADRHGHVTGHNDRATAAGFLAAEHRAASGRDVETGEPPANSPAPTAAASPMSHAAKDEAIQNIDSARPTVRGLSSSSHRQMAQANLDQADAAVRAGDASKAGLHMQLAANAIRRGSNGTTPASMRLEAHGKRLQSPNEPAAAPAAPSEPIAAPAAPGVPGAPGDRRAAEGTTPVATRTHRVNGAITDAVNVASSAPTGAHRNQALDSLQKAQDAREWGDDRTAAFHMDRASDHLHAAQGGQPGDGAESAAVKALRDEAGGLRRGAPLVPAEAPAPAAPAAPAGPVRDLAGQPVQTPGGAGMVKSSDVIHPGKTVHTVRVHGANHLYYDDQVTPLSEAPAPAPDPLEHFRANPHDPAALEAAKAHLDSLHRAAAPAQAADPIAEAERTGHVGEADPAELAKRRSDGELQRITRSSGPDTVEGKAARDELARRQASGPPVPATRRVLDGTQVVDLPADGGPPVASSPIAGDTPALQWGTAKTHGLKQGDRVLYGGMNRNHPRPPRAGTVVKQAIGQRGALIHLDGDPNPTSTGGVATRFHATKVDGAPAAPAAPAEAKPGSSNADFLRQRMRAEVAKMRDDNTVSPQGHRYEGAPADVSGPSTTSSDAVAHAADGTPTAKAVPGRSAKMQRAFQAASEGDHAWLEAHGFSAQPGDTIHVKDDTNHIALGKADGSFVVHRVNGNGRAAGTSTAQSGNTSFVTDNYRQVHEPATSASRQAGEIERTGGVMGRPTTPKA